jgi:phosphate-selective porin
VGQWGAVQVLARYSTLVVDDVISSRGLATVEASPGTQSFTIAINWFPNGFIKYYYGTLERRIRPQRNDRAARGERLSIPDATRILSPRPRRNADLTCAQQV